MNARKPITPRSDFTNIVLAIVMGAAYAMVPEISLSQERATELRASMKEESLSVEPVSLAWKWEAGQTQKFLMEIDVLTKVDTAGKIQLSSNKSVVYGEWKVSSLDGSDALIEQTISRMTMTLKTPELGEISYDSDSKQKPVGLLASIHKSFEKARTSSGKLLRFGSNGSVSVDSAPTDNEKSAESTNIDAQMISLPASLLVLPQMPVTPGETWSHELSDALESKVPPNSMTTKFTLESVGGSPAIAVIKSQTTLEPQESAAKSGPMVIEENISGEHLFDIARGRGVRATRSSKLTTETKYRVTTIRTTVESTVTLTLPAR